MKSSSRIRWAATVLALTISLQPAVADEQFRVGLAGGTSLPISEFGELYNSGFTGTAFFAYELNPGIFVTASVGYNRWEVDNQAINDAVVPVVGVPIALTVEAPVRSIPLMIGVRYSPLPKGIQPYLALQAGVHLLQQDFSGTVTTGPNVTPLPSRSESWSAFGLSAGLGVAVPFARRWAVEVSATYSSVEQAEIRITEPTDPSQNDIGAKALRSYGFFAGVTYAL